MNNLLDWALDFEQNATEKQFMEFFSGNSNAATYARIMKETGFMWMYEAMPKLIRQRFANYLLNRYAIIDNPSIECIPMSDFACFPDTDTDTEVII